MCIVTLYCYYTGVRTNGTEKFYKKAHSSKFSLRASPSIVILAS